jgi:hypothetical protein
MTTTINSAAPAVGCHLRKNDRLNIIVGSATATNNAVSISRSTWIESYL